MVIHQALRVVTKYRSRKLEDGLVSACVCLQYDNGVALSALTKNLGKMHTPIRIMISKDEGHGEM
jgi:hypothetical protein